MDNKRKTSQQDNLTSHSKRWMLVVSLVLAISLILMPRVGAAPVPSLTISTIPLKLANPVRPQVLIAIGNSESMDGTLSGAIMVGAGALSSGLTSLQNSSSPVSYTVPAGFTPPIQGADAGNSAPYTVNQSGTLVDNSASRLNVAKAGIQAIINSYMQNTDFALETYKTSSATLRTTWVYYMSANGGNFSFTNTIPTDGRRYVNNPCYNYTSASTTISSNCTSISARYGAGLLLNNRYMIISGSSDDPDINDVLYAGGQPGVFLTTNGPTPSTPYPPNFSITNYNNGNVKLSYLTTSPSIGSFATGPTNAGYVPFSPQVLFSTRGFGYTGTQQANSGNVLLTMTSVGNNPTQAALTTAINKFTPFLSPETNSTATSEIKSVAGQAPIAGLLTTAKSYLTGLSASDPSCPPKRYVVLISDGLPTQDLSGKYWPPLGSAAAIGYGVTATFNADGSLNTTNDTALSDTISTITALNNAGIKTYVVGLGAGVDPSLNAQAAATLRAMAVAGGTLDYYPATSPEALVADLNAILISVQSGSLDTTAAAISSIQLQVGTVEYQTSFTASDTTYQDWTGNVVEIALDPNTGFPIGSPLWSAQTILDAQVSRIIATWDPTINNGFGGGIPFQWANLSASLQTALQPSDALGANRLAYLRGSHALEKRNGGAFRNRTHLLGDIVDSRPIYVGAPANTALLVFDSYRAFVQANANRQPVLYVGANDGMLHAINASSGAEMFAFIPNAVFNNLYSLTAPLYNQNHLFYVNGPPQSGDVTFSDNTWHTLLIGGEGGGGRSIYALDVTDPTSINSESRLASSILWEFTENDMGLSYSQPQIGQINTNNAAVIKFGIFFGNGYNSPNNKAILYVINPETGTLIRKIDMCAQAPGACNTLKPQGLSSVALAQSDGVQGQPITNVYAGDLQGNMWSVDVSSSNPLDWQARVLFTARDPSGNIQPITTTPVVTLNPAYPRFPGLFVMFGTGQLMVQNDLSDQQIQSIYGVWDKPFLNTTLNRLNLQSQTLNIVTAATSGLSQDILLTTTNAIGWNSQYGWYVDLPIPGQRMITDPDLSNGSFLTVVNKPPPTSCTKPSSMFLDIFYKTGGARPNPQLDIDGSGGITVNDKYNGQNPVGIVLIPGYASTPASVGRNKSNNMVQIITMSGGQQISVINVNNGIRQAGWWQIQ